MTQLLEELAPEPAGDVEEGQLRGVATGIVTDNQDPDRMGRVKVRLPWLDDEADTPWLPVATWMGGSRTGVSFIPEPGDMVVLGFDHGDLNHGYVLGVVRTTNEPPPYDNEDGRNHVRCVVSRSGHELRFIDDPDNQQQKLILKTAGGHELVLDDSDGSRAVRIKTRGGHEIVLDDAQGSEKIAVTDGRGNSLTLSATDGVALKGATRLLIEAPEITVDAKTTLTLKGQLVRLN